MYGAGYKNGDADGMSRYPNKATGSVDDPEICIKDETAKVICFTQVMPYVEVLPTASIYILEASYSAGQPMAQIEIRE